MSIFRILANVYTCSENYQRTIIVILKKDCSYVDFLNLNIIFVGINFEARG